MGPSLFGIICLAVLVCAAYALYITRKLFALARQADDLTYAFKRGLDDGRILLAECADFVRTFGMQAPPGAAAFESIADMQEQLDLFEDWLIEAEGAYTSAKKSHAAYAARPIVCVLARWIR